MGVSDTEVTQLTAQLIGLCDDQGYFNYEEFVKNAFWLI